MEMTRIVETSAGEVEVLWVPGERPAVLFFPGGHCSARSDCGWSVYADMGYAVLSFSRPGYGATKVGALRAADFTPLVQEVLATFDISRVSAVVGVSFGGMQAVHAAADPGLKVPRLVLHSCAPSQLPYPDSRVEATLGPVLFSPLLQGVVWSAVRGMVRSDAGLRVMLARLSMLPIDAWWDELDAEDRQKARDLFSSMRSDSGFVTDLRQATADEAALRGDMMRQVRCPTVITGSRHDRGVSFRHAEDFAMTIPTAELVELDSASHLFWIGPGKERLLSIVDGFLTR
jgi:pimeloyl-ACP methyl ester carboxylesterase